MFFAEAFLSDDSSDDGEEVSVKFRNKELRNSSSILDMPEKEFVLNFRMNKNCFIRLLDEISPRMAASTRTSAIPPMSKLATFLRFAASGSYQYAVGNENMVSMSQGRVSQTIMECLDIFERYVCPKWIRFEMSAEEETEMKAQYYNKFGIPGVIGCVDGTHIRIRCPDQELKHLYYNRKGFYSLNALMICDFDMVVRYVDARHPGANHDAFVWRMSEAEEHLRSQYNAGKRNTWLLGDSAYPLSPYLMTPYREPQQRYEMEFNRKLVKARNLIERCFGVLKNRFRCIIAERGLHYFPLMTTKIINACCALHNICIFYKNNWELTEEIEEEESHLDVEETTTSEGAAVRNEIARNMCI